MGTVVEVLSDDKGIIWPESIAPFQAHLLVLGEDEEVRKDASELYELLKEQNIEVLFDDRTGMSAGEKFADSDLIGIPYRIVVSKRSNSKDGYEVKKRTEEKGNIYAKETIQTIFK
jgi:prolyl-tRNA synthetase